MDLERLKVNGEIVGLRARFIFWTAIQIFSFTLLLTGAILMFWPMLRAGGLPVDILPIEAIRAFKEWTGLSELFLVIIGIILVGVTTR